MAALTRAGGGATGKSSFSLYMRGPGAVLRYNSLNTFVLAAAMDRFLT